MAIARKIAKSNGFRKAVRLAAYAAAMLPLISFASCSPRMRALGAETPNKYAAAQTNTYSVAQKQAVETPMLDSGISYLINRDNYSYDDGFRLLEIKHRHAWNAPFLAAVECLISSRDVPAWMRVIRPDTTKDAIVFGDSYYSPSSWIEVEAEGSEKAKVTLVEPGTKPKRVFISGSNGRAELEAAFPGFFVK